MKVMCSIINNSDANYFCKPTIKELITYLEKYPQSLPVFLNGLCIVNKDSMLTAGLEIPIVINEMRLGFNINREFCFNYNYGGYDGWIDSLEWCLEQKSKGKKDL